MGSTWPDAPDGRALVKVCGVTTVDDAEVCAGEGVDALGLNFWSGSPRCVDVEEAGRIARAVGDDVVVVGLFVDEEREVIAELRERVGFSWVQLHGSEPPELVESLGPTAYKALRVRDATVSQEAARFGGELLLLDAFVPGEAGGTGRAFDWRLAATVSRRRAVVLAGGLTERNVADAVREVRPRAVDVASGVERAPGIKDAAKVAGFVAAVRGAV